MDPSRAWDSAISERWTTPARRILHFPSDGLFQRVGFCDSWAVDYSRVRDSAISERWNVAAPGFRNSWAMERCRAWDSAIPERWTSPAREIL